MTGLLTVHSYGICTHVVDGIYRRTILTNASNKGRYNHYPKLRNVHPHHARLTIFKTSVLGSVPDRSWFRPEDLGDRWEWHLRGVRIEIVNPADGTPNPNVSKCIPYLHTIVPDPLLPRLLEQIDEGNTACHFDYPMVELIGQNIDGGAVFVTASIPTTSAPKLHITRFDDSESLDIDLGLDTMIALSNLPHDKEMGSLDDYLLHFLTTTTVPGNAVPPTTMPTCSEPVVPTLRPKHLGDITGPGCSNTNYP